METKNKISCLLAFTDITSDKKIEALNYYFVDGLSIDCAAAMALLPQPKLSAVIKTLNEVAEKCERYHELKIYQLSGINKKANK